MWQEPVFDRTAADVADGAKKCYISPQLLNRIEGNTSFLANLFDVTVATRSWTASDFLTAAQMQRILNNVQKVRDAYHTLPGTPPLPEMPAIRWDEINTIEQVQWSIRELWLRNQKAKVYIGEIYAGETGVI